MPLVIVSISTSEDIFLRGCHVLFICSSNDLSKERTFKLFGAHSNYEHVSVLQTSTSVPAILAEMVERVKTKSGTTGASVQTAGLVSIATNVSCNKAV